jgi:DnaJ-class molecular chaperone
LPADKRKWGEEMFKKITAAYSTLCENSNRAASGGTLEEEMDLETALATHERVMAEDDEPVFIDAI